jgi:hypothetical protein
MLPSASGFNPEDGGNMFLQSNGKQSEDYMVQQSTRKLSTYRMSLNTMAFVKKSIKKLLHSYCSSSKNGKCNTLKFN